MKRALLIGLVLATVALGQSTSIVQDGLTTSPPGTSASVQWYRNEVTFVRHGCETVVGTSIATMTTCNTTDWGSSSTYTTVGAVFVEQDAGAGTCARFSCSPAACGGNGDGVGWQQAFQSQPVSLVSKPRVFVRLTNDGTWTTNIAVIWVGLASADITTSAGGCANINNCMNSPGAQKGISYVAFRCSATGNAGNPDTNWQACSSDGTTDTCTDTGIACNPSNIVVHELGMDTSSTKIDYYIDNVRVVAGKTTNLPAAATKLGFVSEIGFIHPDGGTINIDYCGSGINVP